MSTLVEKILSVQDSMLDKQIMDMVDSATIEQLEARHKVAKSAEDRWHNQGNVGLGMYWMMEAYKIEQAIILKKM